MAKSAQGQIQRRQPTTSSQASRDMARGRSQSVTDESVAEEFDRLTDELGAINVKLTQAEKGSRQHQNLVAQRMAIEERRRKIKVDAAKERKQRFDNDGGGDNSFRTKVLVAILQELRGIRDLLEPPDSDPDE